MHEVEATVLPFTTTRLGFGCSSLMRLPSARAREQLLGTAFDHGIRHFDVARMYGLGRAEAELGRFSRTRRHELTIATKFGIELAGGAGALAGLQAPVRSLLERVPAAQRAIKRRSKRFATPHRYDVATARRSLETSLRELGTDYVDILFVHDPSPSDAVPAHELVAFFEQQRTAGTIRAWGVSRDAHPGLAVDDNLGPGAALQVREDILNRTAHGRRDFTFGVLSSALLTITIALRTDPARHARWAGRLGSDPLQGGMLATLLLADALDALPAGTVLYNSLKPGRVVAAARALEATVAGEQIAELRALVDEDARALRQPAG